MIVVVAEGEAETLRLVGALHTAADHEQHCAPAGDPRVARRLRRLADSIADQLDVLERRRTDASG